MEMEAIAMKTMALADDLQILSVGPKRLDHFVTAFNKTHAHLNAMEQQQGNG